MRPIGRTKASRASRSFLAYFSSTSGSRSHHAVSIAKLLNRKPSQEAEDVTVNGFVRSIRPMKSFHFVSLGDGSSLAPLQAVVSADQSKGLTNGSAVRLKGRWVPSQGTGQTHELQVYDIHVLGLSDAKTFPMQKKYQTPEYLRTMPHMRSRTPFNSALLRLRSEAIASLTQFFASRNFVQTHPPIITSSDCEGAGEVFTVSAANKTEPSRNGGESFVQTPFLSSNREKAGEAPAANVADEIRSSRNYETTNSFFRLPKYLTVSSQLHLEALAQSVGNVWTLSPTFRAEGSDTSRHLSEFYMLEAEMCFIDDLASVMGLVEDMLRHLARDLHASRVARELLSRTRQMSSDLAPVAQVQERWAGLMQPSWPRLTYSEAISLLSSKEELFHHKPRWGEGLQSEHEKYIATVVGRGKPVFVTQYPSDIKAFYMLRSPPNTDSHGEAAVDGAKSAGATVECFDLLVPEFCEIAGGSMREYRLPQLLEAMRLKGMVTPSLDNGTSRTGTDDGPETSTQEAGKNLDWYVDLRRWGCPPHGGFGLGFDRLLSYLSGVQTIRDVVAFPRWRGRCDC